MISPVSLLVAAALAASPSSFAYVGLSSSSRGDLVQMYDRSVIQSLAETGLPLATGPSPVLEACRDHQSECSAHNAQAIQVGGWIRGTVVREANTTRLTLQFLAADGSLRFVRSVEGPGDAQVLERVRTDAPQWSRDYAPGLNTEMPRAVRRSSWTPTLLVGGGLAAIGGSVLLALARSDYNDLTPTNRTLTAEQAGVLASAGRRKQLLGVTLVGLGVAAVGTGLALYALAKPAAPRTVITPTVSSTSAGISLTGVLP
jgi:hypothetical protein